MSNVTENKKTYLATIKNMNQSLAMEKTQKHLKILFEDPNKRTAVTTSILNMLQQTKALQKCDVHSVFTTSLTGAGLDLPYGFGYWFAIPFNKKENNRIVETNAQFQIGYKGLIQLAKRTGLYEKIIVTEIKEGEIQYINPLTEEFSFSYLHKGRAKAKTIGYYCKLQEKVFSKELYMSLEDVEDHADKYSQAFKLEDYRKLQAGTIPKNLLYKYSSFWYKEFDEMAKKTILKQALTKWASISVENQLGQAIQRDQAVILENGDIDYVDKKSSSLVKNYEVTDQNEEEIPYDKETGEIDNGFFAKNEKFNEKEFNEEEINQLEDWQNGKI